MMIIAGCLTVIGSMMNSNKKSIPGVLLVITGVALAFIVVMR
jgi:hypothetical protein